MAKQSKHVASSPPEFRAEAIRLARTSGKPHAQLARELGMTGETLRLWLKQADLDEGKRVLWTDRAMSRRNSGGCGARTASCGRSGRS